MNCQENANALQSKLVRVVPVSLYRKPSSLRDWLTYYKNGAEEHHPEFAHNVGLLVARFLLEHGSVIASSAGGIDCVVVVPSTERPPPHPLEQVYVDFAEPYGFPLCPKLLVRGTGTLAHRMTSTDGYEVIQAVSGLRVCLLDDVYTTGARGQAAAVALERAGAKVPFLMVVARRINPEYNEGTAALWRRQAKLPFRFGAARVL